MMFKIGGIAGMEMNINAEEDMLAKYEGDKMQKRIIII